MIIRNPIIPMVSSLIILFEYNTSLAWEFKAVGQFVKSSPVIADVDKDGKKEIIAACTQNIYILNHKGEVLKGWPKETWLSEFYQTSRSAAVSDIDNDGEKEIIAISSKNPDMFKINVWNYKGEFKSGWPKYIKGAVDSPYPPAANIVLADLNHDNKNEIIFTAQLPRQEGNLGIVYVFTAEGKELKGWPQTVPMLNGYVSQLTSPAVGDIDNDGMLEVIAATFNGEIYAWKENGRLMQGWPVQTVNSDVFFSGPVLADFDGDGKMEIAAGCCNNNFNPNFYVFKCDGSMLKGWPKQVKGNIQANPVAADINNDDKMEIIFPTNWPGGEIHCLSSEGKELDGWPFAVDPESIITNDAIVADADNDKENEVIISAPRRKNIGTQEVPKWSFELFLFMIKKNGKSADKYPIFIEKGTTNSSSCAFTDLDNDGKAEIILTGDSKLQVINLDIKYSVLKSSWTGLRYNPEHTACHTCNPK